MLSTLVRVAACICLSLYFAAISGCATGGGGGGHSPNNDQGSTPLNEAESIDYSKALIRCHKTGGTRIVKIEGALRCF